MLNKNKLYIGIIVIVLLVGVSIYSYRKPELINKSYSGVIKDINSDKLVGNSNIELSVNYQKAYKIKQFKPIDRIDGNINIDGKDYEIEGITILNDEGNYIGATASKGSNSSYHIFFLDNLEFILLGELGNDEFTKQIVAPAKDENDFDRIIQMLP